SPPSTTQIYTLSLHDALPISELKGVFESQFVENRSHINMGRRIVEEFVTKPVEAELCRWACAVSKRDYRRFLGELSAFVLGHERSEEHTSELQSLRHLVCRLL